ncbi:MAG TPA: AsmA-like C-terminal region-containing protein, partial [Burkholderiales bacterium]|nr:AsmA-like C-terminal region-containing protein [Burkholderiales bacterium]
VSLTLGRVLAAELLRRPHGDEMKMHRANIVLSPPAQALQRPLEGPGMQLHGSLAALDLDRWRPLLAADSGNASAVVDLRVGELTAFGQHLSEVLLRASARDGNWEAALRAQEMAGELAFRAADGGRLRARFAHFRLGEKRPGTPAPALQPQQLPSLDFVAERFSYRGRELGRVELAAERAGADWRIERLAMTTPEARLVASGLWRDGAPAGTSLQFELDTSDAGRFLGRVGYPDVVSGAAARLSGRVGWNGWPGAIDYPSLGGELALEASNGQFLEIDPGFGKLLALMSLQQLPRRIALDFRDVFSKGFAFERIASSGEVDRGVMALKEFRMRGSSAQVDMRGEVDLARETQKLRVRVVPSLGDSAATVIALVNPLLAIPAAIAQKILRDPLGHIFAFDYAVSGGWSDPKVERVGVEAQAAESPPVQ